MSSPTCKTNQPVTVLLNYFIKPGGAPLLLHLEVVLKYRYHILTCFGTHTTCDIHEISFGDPPTPSQWIMIFKYSSTNVNEHL